MVHVLYPSVSCSSYLSYRHDGTDKKEKRKLVQTDLSHLDSGLCSYHSYPDKRFSSAGLCFQSDRGKFRCGIYTSDHLLSSDCMDHHHDFPFTCHVCKRKIWIPLLVFLITTIACTLCFIFATQSYKIPELLSFSFILLIETCIRIGLIPSNDNYLTYSKISSMPFVITDKKLNPVTNHLDDIDITKAQYEESMTKGSLLLSKNIRLSNQNISGGHIFYIEDLSSIIEMVHELSSKNELLSEEKELIAYENELKEQKAKIEKKNQLYDNIFAIVKEDLNQLKELLEKTDKESENCLKNMKKACVYLTYIKRRSNLEILHNQHELINIQEIVLSINESLVYLNECGILASLINNGKGEYNGDLCILLYEFFEYYLKTTFDSLHELILRIDSFENELSLRIISDVSLVSPYGFEKEKMKQYRLTLTSFKEDDLFYTVLTFPIKGGETK